MEYLALYRKYRPSGFDGVVGQEHIISTLANQIMNERLGHAYLFTGTRGTGKTSVAKIFAKAINCENPVDGSPCGKCPSCVALSDPSNVDVIEIDAASNNGVGEIRELKENVQFAPTSCKYKVYIVDEVHMLSGAAFNALLKTLEEPPKHAVFILATTEVHKIPATILSRCMRFDFRLVDTERIASLISEIYTKENKKFEKEAVYAIAKAGEGSVRDALSIADMAMSINNGTLTYEDVLTALGSTNLDLIDKLIFNVLTGNTGEVLMSIEELTSLGKGIGVLVKDLSSEIRDLIVIKTCKDANKILGLPDSRFAELRAISNNANADRLLRILELFSELGNSLRYSNNPRVLFETAILKASRPDSDNDLTALLSRITSLEEKIDSGNIILNSCVKEKQILETEKKDVCEKLNIGQLSAQELKGKLLVGLRAIGSEMLWNVAQKVNVSATEKVLTIKPLKDSDFDVLDMPESKQKIKQALSDFNDFDLIIEQSKDNIELKEIDDATEKIKQIFGDDIVIIKD
ncbi:MAG: DNA polymerase III subunit gamma/tau [Clostridia bacterium]|nr:DNA polymerase III subunit gamma/tau [Clostridia bacterium]